MPSAARHDKLLFFSLVPSAVTLLGMLAAVIVVVLNGSWRSIADFGLDLFSKSVWIPGAERYGLLGPLIGSITSSLIAVAVSLLLSLSFSIFASDILRGRARDLASSLVELMGGMPTVIYALWAAQYLAPALRDFLMAPLHGYLGFIPLFSEEPVTGYSVFTAGVAMGVATVPYVSFLMTEAYSILPSTYREACLGIGASRLETAKILLSLCRPALLASLLLGLARAMGETTIAAMTVGNSMKVTACIIAPGYTVPALVASQFGDASLYVYSESALYAASLVILSAALALSFVGLSLLSRWRSRILV